MLIEVAKMGYEGQQFDGEDAVDLTDLNDDTLKVLGPIRHSLYVYLAEKDLIVTGTLALDIEFTCSRCACAFRKTVQDKDFKTVVNINDLTDVVDLTEEIRETIILAFPTYPVCSEKCKGLCATCGADLNKRKCRCKGSQDFRWSGLNDLKIE